MSIRVGGTPLNVADGLREFARAHSLQGRRHRRDRRLTFAALHERSSRLANALLGRPGLRPGDRAGVLMHNRAEFLETTAALAKSGLVLVPLNPRATLAELGHVLAHADVRVVLVDASCARCWTGSMGCPRWYWDWTALRGGHRRAPATDPMVHFPETHPFTVVYTSGTTGRPKGVVLSHRARVLTFYASALEWVSASARPASRCRRCTTVPGFPTPTARCSPAAR